ncbi:extracellular solute-binding protein [Bacillus sp. FJAT-49705]|uniref:Extracellular solute-binding protein n=1 Tax=Cytobacillus citreus TaxID=2833586 RepID=A0ABS5NVX1_9BACI|nr:extracellular solute-binding protein [Cytobacillus citreus]MBS4191965.1 extracellular solute-binding protein [Cytobacillus citreus]
MKLKKSFLLVMVFILVTSILAGCMGGNNSTENNTETDKKAEKKSLVVYSNSLSDGRGDWLTQKAAEAGFELKLVEAGGGDLLNRIVAEKNKPLADVVFGLNQMNFETLKSNDILVPFEPKWKNELPEGSSDKENFYQPLVEQRIIMLYNKDVYTEETAPKDWTDLIENEEYKGKYHVPINLGGATNQAVVNGILMRYLDENGDLGVSEEGWKALKTFFDNGYKTPEGENNNANLASGKVPISFIYSSGLPGIEEEFGFEAGIVSPKIGVPTLVEQIGIVNKGKDHDTQTAEEFVNWFGSTEIQGAWAEQFGTLPVNEKALEKASDKMKSIFENTTVQDIDYTFISEHINDWIEKIELEIF